jgi:ABC-type sugar transport system substrate-binding protein
VPSSIPTLLVEGDNKAGLGHAIAQAIADAGINVGFLVAQVVGRRYSAVIGFDTEADAKKAAPLIKKATPKKR